ncbi:uroporphyrinogen-III C-methyltransferase [Brevibacillus sp. HB1.2]|uniref:uroporphyrinogen-III C-methyltransferase n=1 Tax=Brevibacillus sp. HB1.2 TaxID=2738807 RepID=UPI00157578E2|nr:uroporphyrinogen-III C-methyltransferase [Brevibacillus sp. HB1.2]NTU22681.1 uroporphyrinogen-III C-methyltransferase [Brevibacillus sp. HB1.2]
MNTGRVVFVGAGPGDPKLLTIRGMESLRLADVIVYDRLASPQLLSYAKKGATLIYCGKEADHHTLPQEEINLLLIREAQKGKYVVRLKGGDPSMFGRVGEEAQMCRDHSIPFEIVPGITSGMAAPLYAGIPLTHRDYNSSVAFVTGHLCEKNAGKEPDWAALASMETLVIYMGVKNLPRIRERLLAHGKDVHTPVALVRWGTVREQETLIGKLGTIDKEVEQARFAAPAIIIVGEVVRLRESLNWYESRPLFGQRVAVAGRTSDEGNSELVIALEQLGAEVLPIPLIKRCTFDTPLTELATYRWLVFENEQQVFFFTSALRQQRFDVRRLTSKLAVCGQLAFEAFEKRGIYPDLVLDENTSLLAFPDLLALEKEEQVLYIGARKPQRITLGHGKVIQVIQAGTVEWDEKHLGAKEAGLSFDWLATDDAHTLSALAQFVGNAWSKTPIVCVGKETAAAAREMGWQTVSSHEDKAIHVNELMAWRDHAKRGQTLVLSTTSSQEGSYAE